MPSPRCGPSFVLAKGTLKLRKTDLDLDSATIGLLLSDASFLYETGDTLRIRLLQDTTVLVDRDFTALGEGKQTTTNDGGLEFTVKTLADTETTNQIRKFTYNSAKGKIALALSGLTWMPSPMARLT
jgi:hypothetical protein